MDKVRVLITGGDTETAGLLREKLSAVTHMTVLSADREVERHELIRSHDADCVISCCRSSSEECEPVLKALMEAGIGVPVIVVSPGWEPAEAEAALERGAYELLPKDDALGNPALLTKTVEHAARHGLAERALEEEKKNLRAIMDSIGESIILQDKDFKVLFQNRANVELMGVHTGEDCYRAFENRSEMCEICPILDSFQDGEVHRVEKRVPLEEGEMFVELTGSTLTDLDGNIVGGVKVVRDVTERKMVERQKADLVAMVSHDLKAPLSVIGGYADLLLTVKKGSLDPEAVEMAAAVKRSCKKLEGMIEDFLTISRMESGELPLKPVPVDVAGLIGEVIEDNSALASAKGIRLSNVTEREIPEFMLDIQLIERALSNLLRNAVGYTPRGGEVSVGAAVTSGAEGDLLEISVTDTGPGIPKEDQAMVFEKYYRSSRSGQQAGSGLGLSVVKAVATAHGGRVGLDSEVGRGSRFRLIIPAR